MLKMINRFYNKLYGKAFYKGYAIKFDGMENAPAFDSYKLADLGTWLTTSGKMWMCTSTITDPDEFAERFFALTRLSPTEVTIEERYFPSLTGM